MTLYSATDKQLPLSPRIRNFEIFQLCISVKLQANFSKSVGTCFGISQYRGAADLLPDLRPVKSLGSASISGTPCGK